MPSLHRHTARGSAGSRDPRPDTVPAEDRASDAAGVDGAETHPTMPQSRGGCQGQNRN